MTAEHSDRPPSGTDINWETPLRKALLVYREHASQGGQALIMTFEEVPTYFSEPDQERVRQWQKESQVLWRAMVKQMALIISMGAPFDEVDTLMHDVLKLRDSDDYDTAARMRLYQDVLRTLSALAAGKRGVWPKMMIQETRGEAEQAVSGEERKPWQRPIKDRV